MATNSYLGESKRILPETLQIENLASVLVFEKLQQTFASREIITSLKRQREEGKHEWGALFIALVPSVPTFFLQDVADGRGEREGERERWRVREKERERIMASCAVIFVGRHRRSRRFLSSSFSLLFSRPHAARYLPTIASRYWLRRWCHFNLRHESSEV